MMVNSIINKLNVTFLIEHWLSNEQKRLLKERCPEYLVEIFSEYSDANRKRGRPYGGTAWIIHKSLRIDHAPEFRSRNISVLKVSNQDTKFLILGIWMPFDDGTLDTLAKTQLIHSEIESILAANDDRICLLVGDWNADPKRGKRFDFKFTDFVNRNNLKICEYDFFNPRTTPIGMTNIQRIWIIFFVLKDSNMICNCQFVIDDLDLSDHVPIVATLNTKTPISSNTNDNNIVFHRFAWSNLDFRARYAYLVNCESNKIYGKLQRIEDPTEEDLEVTIDNINKMLIKCARDAEKHLGLHKTRKHVLRVMRSDSILQDAYSELRYWHNLWIETGEYHAYSSWVSCKKHFRGMQGHASKDIMKAQCSNFNHLLNTDQDKFWKVVHNLKPGKTNVNLDNINFVDYFTKVFAHEENTETQDLVEDAVKDNLARIADQIYEEVVDATDVKNAIDNLNTGKSQGYDNVCSELYKFARDTFLVEILYWLFNKIIRKGIMPKNLNISVINPILKSGKMSTDPADFRPISVSTVLSLIFEDIIRSKISLPTHRNQFGYRAKTSTKHAFLVVRETLSYYSSGHSSCWAASLDASKAFDRLWRAGLFFKLIGQLPDSIWRVLFAYYRSATAVVKVGSKYSSIFVVQEGVKQGGLLSSALFNFFLNDLIINLVELDIGAHVNGLNLSVIAYCDDLILLSPIPLHLQKLLNECQEYSKVWKIKFNPKKSLVYCESGGDPISKELFKLCGSTLERRSSFVYLGLPIGDSLATDNYWEDKYRSVEKAFFSLRSIGLHKLYMNPLCLGFMYKQFCQSIFVYGLEVVPISRQLRKQLDTRQAILLKRALDLSKYSRSRPLLNALKIQSVTELYFKFKALFFKQIKNNGLARTLYDSLDVHYSVHKASNASYLMQLLECKSAIGDDCIHLDKESLRQAIDTKFGSQDRDLVESIMDVLSKYEGLENARQKLKDLVWVEFYPQLSSSDFQ